MKTQIQALPAIEWLPSILAANPLDLRYAVEKVVQSGLKQLHVDVMDGHFVPNISLGPQVTQSIRESYPNLFLDVHLMLERPDRFVEAFLKAGANRLIMHVELDSSIIASTLKQLQTTSCLVGLALNPETPVERLFPYLEQWRIDRILIMSVHPGFSGQRFIDAVLPKARILKERYPYMTLCMDGGITKSTAQSVGALGVKAFVIGASFF